jgi:tetratricopeptide (TPR) repeat protein
MGIKRAWTGKYIYLCVASLTFLFLFVFSCATLKDLIDRETHESLRNGKELLANGDYEGALKENLKVLSKHSNRPPGDEALFNIGLIYAHYGNPKRDYKKSISFFKKLLKEQPESPLAEQAKIWIGVLEVIEKSKQVDVEIEEMKKELSK